MSKDINERLISYRMTMSLVKAMQSRGVISDEEYLKIDTIMTKKYGISSSTIFR